jgi:hypothetical protein
MVKVKRAAPVAAGAAQIKSLNTERYDPKRNGKQAQSDELNEFIADLGVMADWLECLTRHIDQRKTYFVNINALAGCEDLAREVADFNTAARGLIAKFSAKRRAA